MNQATYSLVTLVFFAASAWAAPFQDLSFDSPDFPESFPAPIPGAPFDSAPGEWMIPGWQSSPQSAVGYNYSQRFEGRASLLDINYRNTTQPANPPKVPVVGDFSLGIWPHSETGADGLPFTLSQTGDIPTDTQSLRFLYAGDGHFKVRLGGAEQLVHFAETKPSGDPEIGDLRYYAVDVGVFAGKTAEIRFEFFSFGNYPGMDGGPTLGWPEAKFHVLDDLSFSTLPAVPEPSTWALVGVGLGAVLWWGVRRKL